MCFDRWGKINPKEIIIHNNIVDYLNILEIKNVTILFSDIVELIRKKDFKLQSYVFAFFFF